MSSAKRYTLYSPIIKSDFDPIRFVVHNIDDCSGGKDLSSDLFRKYLVIFLNRKEEDDNDEDDNDVSMIQERSFKKRLL